MESVVGEAMVDGVVRDDLMGEIDWDHLFDHEEAIPNFDGVDDLSFFTGDEFSNPSPALSIGDIEQFLMNDDDAALGGILDFDDPFLSDVLDSPIQSSGSPSGVLVHLTDASAKDCPTPESDNGEQKLHKDVSPQQNGHSPTSESVEGEHLLDNDGSPQQDGNRGNNDLVGEEDDDPTEKKRKRQLRNRDAALRSRERKKMYVRDLEMKSKYFEAECRRLGMLLQCCLAENHALRLSLHSTNAVDASMTKQESAVLLLESLLLGSLLWFLGIIWLLSFPSQLHPTPRKMERVGEENLGPREARSKSLGKQVPQSCIMMGKKCKASRFRMKHLDVLRFFVGSSIVHQMMIV